MQNYFYRDKASQEIGPLTLDALAKLRFAGVLDGDTPVRVADSAEWKPCREIIADPSQPLPPQTSAAPVAKSPLSPVLIALVIIGALVYGGMNLYKSIAAKTTLTYGFFVDGKELSPLQVPEVEVDGQLFASGNHLKPGRHQIAVNLDNVEPYKQHFWVFYGNKNLGTLPLESSKGSLSVTVNPSPATVVLQREGEVVRKGDAPLNVDKLRIGDYTLIIHRGEYEETRSANIQREQQTKVQVDLNLGSADLSSDPADADFELSGNGRHWQGKLPTKIEDVPTGNYSLAVSRKEWELNQDISIIRGSVTTNKTEFQYGSIEVTSDPTGLAVSTNGVEIGKTPLTLLEVKPGQYTLAVSDGENDLLANVSVGPKEAAKHTFAFRYGTVQLASTPTGATVIRKGKEIGKTPLTLNHVPAGGNLLQFALEGYLTTNLTVQVLEGVTTNFNSKLVNQHYADAMSQAREAFNAGKLDESKSLITDALQIEPNDPAAIELLGVAAAAERRAAEAKKEVEHDQIVSIINRAITAKGGRELLTRFKAMKSSWNYSGTVPKNGKAFSMHTEEYIQSPDKVRLNQTISYPQTSKSVNVLGLSLSTQFSGSEVRQSVCLNGSSSWAVDSTMLGSFRKVAPDGMANLNATLYSWQLSRLFPLLDEQFRLSLLSTVSYAPDNSVAIGVQADGHPDVVLFFDKSSNFLVGIETLGQQNGRISREVMYFSDFINASGLKCPTVVESKTDGVRISSGRSVWITPCEELPDEVFSPPAR